MKDVLKGLRSWRRSASPYAADFEGGIDLRSATSPLSEAVEVSD